MQNKIILIRFEVENRRIIPLLLFPALLLDCVDVVLILERGPDDDGVVVADEDDDVFKLTRGLDEDVAAVALDDEDFAVVGLPLGTAILECNKD